MSACKAVFVWHIKWSFLSPHPAHFIIVLQVIGFDPPLKFHLWFGMFIYFKYLVLLHLKKPTVSLYLSRFSMCNQRPDLEANVTRWFQSRAENIKLSLSSNHCFTVRDAKISKRTLWPNMLWEITHFIKLVFWEIS